MPDNYSEPKKYTPRQLRNKQIEYQPKGEPKEGRKASKPKVTDDDGLSSAHKNEQFRKDDIDRYNRGGRG